VISYIDIIIIIVAGAVPFALREIARRLDREHDDIRQNWRGLFIDRLK
jgi:hypothetical protein